MGESGLTSFIKQVAANNDTEIYDIKLQSDFLEIELDEYAGEMWMYALPKIFDFQDLNINRVKIIEGVHDRTLTINEKQVRATWNEALDSLRKDLMKLKAGDLVASRYELQSQLGDTRFFATWRALDTETGNTVVLRHMLPEHSNSDGEQQENIMERLLKRERSLSEQISERGGHKNIASFVDIVEIEYPTGEISLALVREYVEGEKLSACNDHSQADVFDIAVQLADALAFFHNQDIVLRVLRPDDIILREDDQTPIIVDLKFAVNLTEMDSERNSMVFNVGERYTAPEVKAEGTFADASADTFALGRILGGEIVGLTPMNTNRPFNPLEFGMEVDDWFAYVIAKSTIPNRNERISTGDDFKSILNRYEGNDNVSPDDIEYQPWDPENAAQSEKDDTGI